MFVLRRGGLCHGLVFFGLGGVIDGFFVQHHTTILNAAIGGFNETEVVNLSVNTEGGDKTDIGAFRSLDSAESSIMGVVNVTNLKSGTLTRQTARTQC